MHIYRITYLRQQLGLWERMDELLIKTSRLQANNTLPNKLYNNNPSAA
jgi:hypothetical protein